MSEQPVACRIHVQALAPAFQPQAEQWAERLGLPMQVDDGEFALQVGEQGLQLQQLGPDAPGRCGWTSSKAVRPIVGCTAAAAAR